VECHGKGTGDNAIAGIGAGRIARRIADRATRRLDVLLSFSYASVALNLGRRVENSGAGRTLPPWFPMAADRRGAERTSAPRPVFSSVRLTHSIRETRLQRGPREAL